MEDGALSNPRLQHGRCVPSAQQPVVTAQVRAYYKRLRARGPLAPRTSECPRGLGLNHHGLRFTLGSLPVNPLPGFGSHASDCTNLSHLYCICIFFNYAKRDGKGALTWALKSYTYIILKKQEMGKRNHIWGSLGVGQSFYSFFFLIQGTEDVFANVPGESLIIFGSSNPLGSPGFRS